MDGVLLNTCKQLVKGCDTENSAVVYGRPHNDGEPDPRLQDSRLTYAHGLPP